MELVLKAGHLVRVRINPNPNSNPNGAGHREGAHAVGIVAAVELLVDRVGRIRALGEVIPSRLVAMVWGYGLG